MRYDFLPEAREEMFAAADYYEDKESGLGALFIIDVDQTIELVLSAPYTWQVLIKTSTKFI